MFLHKIRSGSKSELEAKHYNIGVGASLGNKWFTPEHTLGLIEWSLLYTREIVVVYVADSIHALNIEARTQKNERAAKNLAIQQGGDFLRVIQEKVESILRPDEVARVSYAHWDELVDITYQKKVAYLYQLFKENGLFSNAILDLVQQHVSKEQRSFSEWSLKKMAYYILEELPECMNRVKIGGIVVDAFTYPSDGALTDFVEKLQTGEFFPEVKAAILDTEPKVFLEVR